MLPVDAAAVARLPGRVCREFARPEIIPQIAHSPKITANAITRSILYGLESTLAPFRSVRPVRTLLYLNAQFMWLLSDPTTRLADPDGIAAFTVDRDRFDIRGGAGPRFSWMGFDTR
jgi:hypothetical protein